MTLLLDTHALLWWLADIELGDDARAAIADPDALVVVSATSIWEMSIKRQLGKLDIPGDITSTVADAGFDLLPIEGSHAASAGALPPHHRDPFDRMLIAQAQLEALTLVTRDPAFAAYEVETLLC